LEAYEAPILETLVALTYLLLGREALWVARLYSVLFWTLTGWLVFRWTWRATGEPWAGWGALAYLMALPFAVKASRAFQPDPLMTLLITMTGYMWWSWSQTKRHRDLVLGTGAAAMACLVKPFAVYFITPLLSCRWAYSSSFPAGKPRARTGNNGRGPCAISGPTPSSSRDGCAFWPV